MYVHRQLEKTIRKYLSHFPVIGLTGPRQSGKSTMLLNLLQDYEYVTFDDPKIVSFFINDPEGFMQRYNNRIIFDEVQHVPQIFNYLKMAVDQDRNNYGKFVITGSSQFAFMVGVSESLAGRIGLLTLLPFQYNEMPRDLLTESIYQGGYPELVLNEYEASEGWFAAYLDTYINKDLRSVGNVGDLRDFRRFINLLAGKTSQILNMSDCARDIGVSVPTIKNWISMLEASYIIFLLPPYFNNFGKRIVKSPKIYFYDTGLVSYLTGIITEAQFAQGPMAGSIFENYIVAEVLKKELHNKTNAELYYLRTMDKAEVDLIVDKKLYREFIEIKKTATFKPKMVSTIKQLITSQDQGFVLYTGKDFQYAKNICAKNYQDYLS